MMRAGEHKQKSPLLRTGFLILKHQEQSWLVGSTANTSYWLNW